MIINISPFSHENEVVTVFSDITKTVGLLTNGTGMESLKHRYTLLVQHDEHCSIYGSIWGNVSRKQGA